MHADARNFVWVSYSKSFGSLIRSYGRGKGLSIAALCSNFRANMRIPHPTAPVIPRVHLGSHLGVNRGSFRRRTPSETLRAACSGGGRRG